MALKIADVEKFVSSVEKSMSTKISVIEESVSNKISAVENSMANIRDQIISEDEQCLKMQPKQLCEQTVPMIKTENKLTKKVTLPAVGTVHVKAPTFDGRSHWATYLRRFEAAACANNWKEKHKAVSLVLALNGPAAKLLQKLPPDSHLSLIHI